MGGHFGVRELAPAFAKRVPSGRLLPPVEQPFAAANLDLHATAASCLTQSGSKLRALQS
jgi:hypothetical protein